MKQLQTIGVWDKSMPLGIYEQTNDDYHASEGISKTGLWEIWTKTPAHYQYGERKPENHFSFGSAAHAAVLEPEIFERGFLRGPEDRRGKKWDEAQLIAAEQRMEALTAKDYDAALRIRDNAHANELVRTVLAGAMIEKSGFAKDKRGIYRRCKLDAYNPGMAMAVDLKTAANASPPKFSKSVFDYGYHVQEAMYSQTWEEAGGGSVEAFLFIVFEKTHPYMVVPYELERGAYQEGFATYQLALDKYAACEKSGVWPGYPSDVTQIDIPGWSYQHTKRPELTPDEMARIAGSADSDDD